MNKQTFIIAVGIIAGAIMLVSVWELFALMKVRTLSPGSEEDKQEVDLIKLVEQWERKKPFEFTAPPSATPEATESAQPEL